MKKIAIIILTFACLIGQAQNSMTYSRKYVVDTIKSKTVGIDITDIKTKGLMTKAVALTMEQYKGMPNIIDSVANKRLVHAALASIWSNSVVTSLLQGNYSGIDTSIAGVFDLYFSDDNSLVNKRNDMLIRFKHEIDAGNQTKMDVLTDSVVIGIRTFNDTPVVGKLTINDKAKNVAMLKNKKGNQTFECYWYSISKADATQIKGYY